MKLDGYGEATVQIPEDDNMWCGQYGVSGSKPKLSSATDNVCALSHYTLLHFNNKD